MINTNENKHSHRDCKFELNLTISIALILTHSHAQAHKHVHLQTHTFTNTHTHAQITYTNAYTNHTHAHTRCRDYIIWTVMKFTHLSYFQGYQTFIYIWISSQIPTADRKRTRGTYNGKNVKGEGGGRQESLFVANVVYTMCHFLRTSLWACVFVSVNCWTWTHVCYCVCVRLRVCVSVYMCAYFHQVYYSNSWKQQSHCNAWV